MGHDEEVRESDQVELLLDLERAGLGLLVDVQRRRDHDGLGAVGSARPAERVHVAALLDLQMKQTVV